MKLIFVVDSITDIRKKINMLSEKFNAEYIFVVKNNLYPVFKTYEYTTNGIYSNNLMSVIHSILLKTTVDDILICYSSLNFDDYLLNKFRAKIGNGQNFVSLMPKYNFLEQINNNAYNIYVKTLFKLNDSMLSQKLQFIPASYAIELIKSHLGNRMFAFDENLTSFITPDSKSINKSSKNKTFNYKALIVPLLISLIITSALLCCIANNLYSYIIIACFIVLYLLDIVFGLICYYKTRFDNRFLN